MIAFNNGVANVRQTPGISADTLTNRPVATVVAVGTIYITTDTNNIYRSDGENWVLIGSGSGVAVGIDSVLAVGQALTTTRQIDLANNTLQFVDNSQAFTDVAQFVYNDIRLGNNNTGCKLLISGLSFFTQSGAQNKGINLDFDTGTYILGTEQHFIEVSETKIIRTYLDSVKFGLQIDKNANRSILGDYDGSTNKIIVDTSSIQLNSDTAIVMGTNNITPFTIGATSITLNGANLSATTAGGASGKHLKITLNGVAYKIALNNV